MFVMRKLNLISVQSWKYLNLGDGGEGEGWFLAPKQKLGG